MYDSSKRPPGGKMPALLPPALLYALACQAGTARAASTLGAAIASADVVMFTLPTCPFCKEAARALKVSDREGRQVGPEVGPTSTLYSRVTTGMHGPTCIFCTHITPFLLKAAGVEFRELPIGPFKAGLSARSPRASGRAMGGTGATGIASCVKRGDK